MPYSIYHEHVRTACFDVVPAGFEVSGLTGRTLCALSVDDLNWLAVHDATNPELLARVEHELTYRQESEVSA